MLLLNQPSNEYHNYLSDPEKLYSLIRERLNNRTPQTHKYADVPYRHAAVIIPLFFKKGESYLLFTKRTNEVEHHKGQISFPGGMHDAEDEDLKQTALRETWEEMGIKAEDLTILGRTDDFLTNTNFMVRPFVAYFPHPYPYKVNTAEIAKVIEVPLRHLLNSKIFRVEKWKRKGILWDVLFYDYFGENIWGVTGFLLSNFLSIIFNPAHIHEYEPSNKNNSHR